VHLEGRSKPASTDARLPGRSTSVWEGARLPGRSTSVKEGARLPGRSTSVWEGARLQGMSILENLGLSLPTEQLQAAPGRLTLLSPPPLQFNC
jgi:hypothetical protein